jgi:hypothetical protein
MLQRSHPKVATVLEDVAYTLSFKSFRDPNWRSIFNPRPPEGRSFEQWLATILWPHSANSVRPLTFSELDFDLTIAATD